MLSAKKGISGKIQLQKQIFLSILDSPESLVLRKPTLQNTKQHSDVNISRPWLFDSGMLVLNILQLNVTNWCT